MNTARRHNATAVATLIGAVAHTAAPNVSAQIVGIECCVIDADMQQVGVCLSGPGEVVRPKSCPTWSRCTLQIGTDFEPYLPLCESKEIAGPAPERAACTTWKSEGASVAHECVAAAGVPGLNLFHLLDHDDESPFDQIRPPPGPQIDADKPGDGDLDLVDFAVFQRSYTLIPNAEQPRANPFAVECCLDESGLRQLGGCIGGPAATLPPPGCDAHLSCVVAFPEPVGPGDYLYQLCRDGEPILPDLTKTCFAAQDADFEPAFLCQAAPLSGVTTFAAFDADRDGDLDLADYASYPYSLAIPPP